MQVSLGDLGPKLGFEVQSSSSIFDILKKIPATQCELVFLDCTAITAEQIADFFQKLRKLEIDSLPDVVMVVEDLSQQMIALSSEYNAVSILTVKNLKDQLEPRLKKLLEGSEIPPQIKAAYTALDQASASGNLSELNKTVSDLYVKFPQNQRIQFEYANLCLRQRNTAEAEEIAKKILAATPGNIRANNIMSRVYMLTGRHKEATVLLSQCDLLSPSNVDRLLLLGDCYLSQGLTSQAKEKYGKVLSIDPNSKDAKKALGTIELSTGDINDALDLLNDVSSEEELASIFNNAAVMAVRDGDIEKGLKLYNNARGPTKSADLVSKITFNMGLAYKKNHHYKASEICFAESFRLNPANTKAAEQLAIAQEMVSKTGGNVSSTLPLPLFEPSESPKPMAFKQPSVEKPSSFGSIITIDKNKKVEVKKTETPKKEKKAEPTFTVKGFMDDDE